MEQTNNNSMVQPAGAPKVLLTDTNRWPATARLAVSLSKSGCEVSAICPTGHPLLKTRALRQGFPYSGLRPLEALRAAIEATEAQFIIPCDDRGVEHLHELFEWAQCQGESAADITALIKRSLGSPESYPIVSSRYDLLRIALDEGLSVPDTKPIKSVDDFESWQVDHTLPWVLKADGSFGGRGVKIANSREHAEQFFLEMHRPQKFMRVIKRLVVNRDQFFMRPWWNHSTPNVIAQSYIHGHPANCAVVCWEGRVLAGVGVEVVSSDGLTGPASVVRVVDNPQMMSCSERIARRLGLSGFFGLDFMIEECSGAALLIEMNPRCTPLCHLQLGKGRDMVGELAAKLSGRLYRGIPPVTLDGMIAYFPQAWASKSEFLESSFQDIPMDEPELVQELLRPWPDRSLLFRLGHFLTTALATQKSND